MKKIIIAMFCVVFSANVYAGKGSQPENEINENNGVITPKFATGMYRTYKFTYSDNLEILICPHNANYERGPFCKDNNGNNSWRLMKDIVPKDKTFVGFKSVSQGSSNYIEIYWK